MKLFVSKHAQNNNEVQQEIDHVDLKIHYYKSFDEVNRTTDDNNFVAIIDNIKSSSDLFNACYEQLKFPEYFGFNWDALIDCLSDFSWLTQKNVVLIHMNLEQMPLDLLYDYIDVLFICYARLVNYLKKYPEKYPEESEIHAYFDIKHKEHIDTFFNEISERRKYMFK